MNITVIDKQLIETRKTYQAEMESLGEYGIESLD